MLHSMCETIGLNKRAIGIWWRESPGMLVSLFFYVVTGALLPYAGIYFSARIITELSGAKDPVILRNLVLLLLGIESVAGLLYHYFKNRYTVERNDMTANLTQILSEKCCHLILQKWMIPSFRIRYYRLNKLTGGAGSGYAWLSLPWKGCCRQLQVLPEH